MPRKEEKRVFDRKKASAEGRRAELPVLAPYDNPHKRPRTGVAIPSTSASAPRKSLHTPPSGPDHTKKLPFEVLTRILSFASWHACGTRDIDGLYRTPTMDLATFKSICRVSRAWKKATDEIYVIFPENSAHLLATSVNTRKSPWARYYATLKRRKEGTSSTELHALHIALSRKVSPESLAVPMQNVFESLQTFSSTVSVSQSTSPASMSRACHENPTFTLPDLPHLKAFTARDVILSYQGAPIITPAASLCTVGDLIIRFSKYTEMEQLVLDGIAPHSRFNGASPAALFTQLKILRLVRLNEWTLQALLAKMAFPNVKSLHLKDVQEFKNTTLIIAEESFEKVTSFVWSPSSPKIPHANMLTFVRRMEQLQNLSLENMDLVPQDRESTSASVLDYLCVYGASKASPARHPLLEGMSFINCTFRWDDMVGMVRSRAWSQTGQNGLKALSIIRCNGEPQYKKHREHKRWEMGHLARLLEFCVQKLHVQLRRPGADKWRWRDVSLEKQFGAATIQTSHVFRRNSVPVSVVSTKQSRHLTSYEVQATGVRYEDVNDNIVFVFVELRMLYFDAKPMQTCPSFKL